MRFWRRLRWMATFAFVALIALSWMGTERTGPSRASGDRAPRTAPIFHH
jgi:hypothetical protein